MRPHDYSDEQIISLDDADFEAYIADRADEMLDQAVRCGRECGDEAEKRDPGMRARLEAHWQEHPEEKAAADRAGEEQRAETRELLIKSFRESWKVRREQRHQGSDLAL